MASTLKDSLVHWRKKLERTTDEIAILTTIHKLSKVPITVNLLQDTGIGKIIRSLAKKNGKVGSKASSVLQNWRNVVASSQKGSASSPKHEHTKHNSHKKEVSNGGKLYDEKYRKRLSSSHEKHRKSKQSSDSSHKQKRINGNLEYAPVNISSSTSVDKHATSLIHPDDIKKEKSESTYGFNSGIHHMNGDLDAAEKLFDTKESFENRKAAETRSLKNGVMDVKKPKNEYGQTYNNIIAEKNIKKEYGQTYNNIIAEKNIKKEYGQTFNNIIPEKNIKKEYDQTFNDIIDEENIDEENIDEENIDEENIGYTQTFISITIEKNIQNDSSPINNDISNERKRKYEVISNGIPGEKKHKTEVSFSSSFHSSPLKSELVNDSTYKKRDKDKKASKYKDKKITENSLSKPQRDFNKTHESEKSIVKKKKESKKKSSSKLKTSIKMEPTEAFTSSEVRFEDCLSFNDIVPVKRKKTSKSASEKKEKHVPLKKEVPNGTVIHKNHTSSSRNKHKVKTEIPDLPDLLLEPAPILNEVDILSTLPQTQPTYRPLPQRNYDSPIKKKVLSNEEAIKFTSSRREKTSVYSGRKNVFYTEVPTLFDSCIRVLIENIDAIEYMGGVVPYYILKQVLVRCSSQQLHNIEDYNPYLLEDTQELWEVHCKKDFRNHKPQENETWRDLYWRASEEREKKLRSITANISASMTTKYKPGRSVKLAYVDSFVKPPRDVARKQAKHGTALPVNHPVKAGPPSKATPRPVAPVINSAASHSREFVPKKPKVAPLMAKTLKSMKQCFRR